MRKKAVAAVLFLCVGLASPAGGQTFRTGDLVIEDPWARATVGMTTTGVAYLSISNHGADADRIVAVATPVAERAELHAHAIEDGVMRMRPVSAVEAAPGEPTAFAPGGLHIMLFGLKAPLSEGDRFPLTLSFERAGPLTVEVTVLPIGATGPGTGGTGHGAHG